MTIVSSQFGAYQAVPDLAARNAIPEFTRVEGMSVYVIDDDITYRLLNGTTDGYWESVFQPDPITTENTLYVDPVAGNDGYDGLIGTPLATIQEAINRFLPAHLPPQQWPTEVTKKIIVQFTPGMSPVEENIIKPAHLGTGVMVIEGEELEAFALTQNGARVSVAGHNSLRQFNFTTTPLTPDTLDGYFLSTSTDTLFGNESLAYLANFPIISNEDGYVIVPSGTNGPTYGNGVGVRILAPQIRWRSPTVTGGTISPYVPQIINNGGVLQIRGFELRQNAASALTVADLSGGTDIFSGATSFVRCLVDTTDVSTTFTTSSNNLLFGGCKFALSGALNLKHVLNLKITNSFITLNSAVISMPFIGEGNLGSCYISKVGGGSTHLQLERKAYWFVSDCDFRGGADIIIFDSTLQLQNSTFEGCGSNCVEVRDKGKILGMTNVTGSVNNGGFGVFLQNGSQLKQLNTDNTVTATSGDIKVGAAPVTTWGELPLTDVSTLTRAE